MGARLRSIEHATQKVEARFGEGNGDGHAAPGETFAVLLPEGGALRAAELFTNDACVDNAMRGSDSWDDYDHSGASVKYSLPSIHVDCEPGQRGPHAGPHTDSQRRGNASEILLAGISGVVQKRG